MTVLNSVSSAVSTPAALMSSLSCSTSIILLLFLSFPHLQTWGGKMCSFFGVIGWVVALHDCLACSLTNQDRHEIHVKVRHVSTFAPCVNLLLLRYACKLTVPRLRSNPPTVENPYLVCLTNVPRLTPRERVPPYGLRSPPFAGCKR